MAAEAAANSRDLLRRPDELDEHELLLLAMAVLDEDDAIMRIV